MKNFLWDTLELSQGSHRRPDPLIDHLAYIQSYLSSLCPSLLQENLKQRPHDTSCTLRDINHIRTQGISVQFKLAYIRLKQDIDFRSGISVAPLDRQRDAFQQFLQLVLLLLPDRDKLELRGQAENLKDLYHPHVRLNMFVIYRDGRVLYVIMRGDFP